MQRSWGEEHFRQKKELVQQVLQWEQANIAGTKGVRGRVTEEKIGESERDQIT